MTQTTEPRPDNWPDPWQPGAEGSQGSQSDLPAGPPAAPADQPANQPDDQPVDLPDAPVEPPPTSFGADSYPTDSYPTPGYPTPSYPTDNYPTAGYSPPAPTYPAADGYPYSTPPTPQQGGYPPPPAGGSFAPTPKREPRRPGWLGVAGIGIGAAVLSSLLTAGLVNRDQSTTFGSTSTGGRSGATSAQPQPAGPVTTSSAQAPDWSAVAAAVEPTVVAVKVASQGGSGEGSGVLLDTKGNVLTNNHVVAGAGANGQIQVVLSDGRGYQAQIVGTDPQTDLAVIRIDKPPAGLKPAILGDSAAVKVGDPVMAVGNPLGLSDTVTTGIVSAVDRPVTTGSAQDQAAAGANGTVFTNAIQTDAAINPGNSGGALVDVQGRLIGINSSIASLGSQVGGSQVGSIGLGFAIPVNEAKDVAEQLLASGKVAHAFLGVTLRDGSVSLDGAERQSAQIGDVTSGAPADDAGLKTGDHVVAIDGDQVFGSDSLIAQVRERRPGVTVTLTVIRNGATQDVKLTLGTRPND